jgi:Spy/CpxP family protein refolding chaperone
MDIFAQNKLLIRSIIVLILLNVCCISFFVWHNSGRGPALFPTEQKYRDVSGVLQKELNLSTQQVEQFKSIRSDFYEKEKVLTKTIRDERDSMNMMMFNQKTDTALVKILAREVSENEYQMELLRIAQSQELKSVCTPEQLNKFEQLVKEIRDYVRPDNQPPKH